MVECLVDKRSIFLSIKQEKERRVLYKMSMASWVVLIICCIMCVINSITQVICIFSYLKNKIKKDNGIINISRGMNKRLLLDYCNKAKLNELETNILIDFYCNRYSIDKIAINNNYSYDSIYIIKKKSLIKIRECFK